MQRINACSTEIVLDLLAEALARGDDTLGSLLHCPKKSSVTLLPCCISCLLNELSCSRTILVAINRSGACGVVSARSTRRLFVVPSMKLFHIYYAS